MYTWTEFNTMEFHSWDKGKRGEKTRTITRPSSEALFDFHSRHPWPRKRFDSNGGFNFFPPSLLSLFSPFFSLLFFFVPPILTFLLVILPLPSIAPSSPSSTASLPSPSIHPVSFLASPFCALHRSCAHARSDFSRHFSPPARRHWLFHDMAASSSSRAAMRSRRARHRLWGPRLSTTDFQLIGRHGAFLDLEHRHRTICIELAKNRNEIGMEREAWRGWTGTIFYGGATGHCWTPNGAAAQPPPRCPVFSLQVLQTSAGGLQKFASSPLGGTVGALGSVEKRKWIKRKK